MLHEAESRQGNAIAIIEQHHKQQETVATSNRMLHLLPAW